MNLILHLDVDECTDSGHNCNANAVCNNTAGSFTCSCNAGYIGNGVNCTGKIFNISHYFIIQQKGNGVIFDVVCGVSEICSIAARYIGKKMHKALKGSS